jgi:hypothetical protein
MKSPQKTKNRTAIRSSNTIPRVYSTTNVSQVTRKTPVCLKKEKDSTTLHDKRYEKTRNEKNVPQHCKGYI